jgi:DNA-binding MarR family transcriptional regulator
MSDGPESCFNLAARRHARAITRTYDRHLAPAGLSSSQFSILAIIERGETMTIADLAQALVMERTTLMRALARLENEGFVDRQQEEGKRSISLTLTVAGRAKLKSASPLWHEAQRAYVAQVGGEEATRLRESINRLIPSA